MIWYDMWTGGKYAGAAVGSDLNIGLKVFAKGAFFLKLHISVKCLFCHIWLLQLYIWCFVDIRMAGESQCTRQEFEYMIKPEIVPSHKTTMWIPPFLEKKCLPWSNTQNLTWSLLWYYQILTCIKYILYCSNPLKSLCSI